MRKLTAVILLMIIAVGTAYVLAEIPYGSTQTKIGDYFIKNGVEETGAVNIVTSVVLNYRGLDTLGEITVLLTAAIGLGLVLGSSRKRKDAVKREPASLIVYTGCRFLFPVIMLTGFYIFIHGHLTPGGGFQGGAIAASGFLLMYLGCSGKRINTRVSTVTEVLGGIIFIGIGLAGLILGHEFLFNFLPKGEPNTLFSSGIIPLIYVAVGFKVGSELAGIIDNLMETGE
jgi:multicomponent Na+:H+ antiporter subunit B